MRGRGARIALATVAATVGAALAAPAQASAKTVWLCKPGQSPNPCYESLRTTYVDSAGAATVATPKLARKPRVDCFYVYPTVSDQESANADLTVDPEISAIARYQASRFSQRCRVFAPVYRQLTLQGINDPALPAEALQLAYTDVRNAWREYMKKHNKGRGVVLVGHSQGTGMLTLLAREKIDPFPKVRRRLVSALLLGGNVTVKRGSDRGGAFQNIPACRSKKQQGCVVAYSAFNDVPPDGALSGTPDGALVEQVVGPGRADLEVLCTNPAALGGGQAPLRTLVPSSPFPGTIGLGILLTFNGERPVAPTPWIQPQDHYEGLCVTSNGARVLMVTPVALARTLVPVPDPTWGIHLADVNIALGDLTELVRSQSRAYLKARDRKAKKSVLG